MQIAIAVGTMLLGGWVLSSPIDEDQSESLVEEPKQRIQAPSTPLLMPGPGDRMERGSGRTAKDRGSREHGRTAQGDPSASAQEQAKYAMPAPPTGEMNPDDSGMSGQPSAPTANMPPGGLSTTGGMGQGSFRSQPVAPTSSEGRYRSQSSSAASHNRGSSRFSGSPGLLLPQQAAPAQNTAPAATQKAFAGYRAPSGVSPYMNLFRRDSGGTVDNYTSLVRPQIEQRFLNQQMGQDIFQERNARIQQQMMMQQQQQRTLQSVGTPDFYMNTPSFGYGQ